jgi:glycerol-3-phosphate acyltransferase PlsX
MLRIALDAMGGDHAPGAIVRGGVEALALRDDFTLHLVGDEQQIKAILSESAADISRIHIIHATEVVTNDEPPVEAIRQKKDSSLLKMCKVAADGELDAVISAGNTGAFVAACQLKMRALPGVSRPGVAVAIPSFHGPFVICDCGANIQAKPQHLYEYGVMAGLYSTIMLGIENPRVALLSVGEESAKGTQLVKQARTLLDEDENVNFVGNMEGADIFKNVCDVTLCDGFVGNIVLKFVEGVAEGFFHTIRRELAEERTDAAMTEKIETVLNRVWSRHDYSAYGGAPLLGVDGCCIICHGRSEERAIRNAVAAACKFVESGYNRRLVDRLATVQGSEAAE